MVFKFIYLIFLQKQITTSKSLGNIDYQNTYTIGNQSKGKMLKSHLQISSKDESSLKNPVSEFKIPKVRTYGNVDKTRTMSTKLSNLKKCRQSIRLNCGESAHDQQRLLDNDNCSKFIIERTCKNCDELYKIPSTLLTQILDKEMCGKCRNAPEANTEIKTICKMQTTNESDEVICYKCWNDLVANPEISVLMEIPIKKQFYSKSCNRCHNRFLVSPKIIFIDSNSHCSESLLSKAMADQNKIIDVSKEID